MTEIITPRSIFQWQPTYSMPFTKIKSQVIAEDDQVGSPDNSPRVGRLRRDLRNSRPIFTQPPPQHLINTSARSLHKRMRRQPLATHLSPFCPQRSMYTLIRQPAPRHATCDRISPQHCFPLNSGSPDTQPANASVIKTLAESRKCHNYCCPSMIMSLARQGLR